MHQFLALFHPSTDKKTRYSKDYKTKGMGLPLFVTASQKKQELSFAHPLLAWNS